LSRIDELGPLPGPALAQHVDLMRSADWRATALALKTNLATDDSQVFVNRVGLLWLREG
jgi:hypothetical protein